MNGHNHAEIISIGTEILRGEIIDTNAGYLAAELPLLGIELRRMSTAPDVIDELAQLIRQALEKSSLVITSGGLGPTGDDLTRDSIAAVLGEQMAIDPGLEDQLRSMFARMGREMPAHNLRQALLIPSAEPLPNPRGTAPGWWVEKDGRVIVALPGPPRELMPMWRNEVMPRLRERFTGRAIMARTVKTFIISEARVAELMQPFFESDNPSLGIYAKPDGIHVRLIAHGDNAVQLLDDAQAAIEEALAPHVWGQDEDSLQDVISTWLSQRGLTLATFEDGTSGLLARAVADAVGGVDCYRSGLVVRSTDAIIRSGVPAELVEQHGAVSAEVAEAMASAARERFGADFGLSTSGITGLDDSEGKPPGLAFIGFADSRGTRSWQQNYPPSRGDARERGAIAALFRLRESLLELGLDAA